jgi:protein KRI1
MAKRKADALGTTASTTESKKVRKEKLPKNSNLLDSDSESENGGSDGGAPLESQDFKINEEYARRFEHNKKREELQRCR